jgi:hypothetical protein
LHPRRITNCIFSHANELKWGCCILRRFPAIFCLTACLEVVVAGMDLRVYCTPFACAIPRSEATKTSSYIEFSEALSPPWPSAGLILVHLLWPKGGRCHPLRQNIGQEGEDGRAIANKGWVTRRRWHWRTNARQNVIKEGDTLEEINLIALAYRTN